MKTEKELNIARVEQQIDALNEQLALATSKADKDLLEAQKELIFDEWAALIDPSLDSTEQVVPRGSSVSSSKYVCVLAENHGIKYDQSLHSDRATTEISYRVWDKVRLVEYDKENFKPIKPSSSEYNTLKSQGLLGTVAVEHLYRYTQYLKEESSLTTGSRNCRFTVKKGTCIKVNAHEASSSNLDVEVIWRSELYKRKHLPASIDTGADSMVSCKSVSSGSALNITHYKRKFDQDDNASASSSSKVSGDKFSFWTSHLGTSTGDIPELYTIPQNSPPPLMRHKAICKGHKENNEEQQTVFVRVG